MAGHFQGIAQGGGGEEVELISGIKPCIMAEINPNSLGRYLIIISTLWHC